MRRENYRAMFKGHITPENTAEFLQATNGDFVSGSRRPTGERAQMLGR